MLVRVELVLICFGLRSSQATALVIGPMLFSAKTVSKGKTLAEFTSFNQKEVNFKCLFWPFLVVVYRKYSMTVFKKQNAGK